MEGALISYGPDSVDIIRRSAGTSIVSSKVKDRPTFRCRRRPGSKLVINLKTAKALGLEVPPHLQQLADEVIE
jgi:putative ABC transport system substrate-binding protein